MKTKISKIFLLITTIVSSIVVTASFLFARPISDEYWYANMVLKYGFWESFTYWMNNFSSMPIKEAFQFIFVAAPAAYLDWHVAMALPLFLSLFIMIASLYYLFHSFIFNSKKTSLYIALITSLTFFISTKFVATLIQITGLKGVFKNHYIIMSWLGDLFFWTPSTVAYILTISLILLMVTLLVKIIKTGNTRNTILTASIIGLLIGWTSYSTILTIVIFSMFLFFILLKIKQYKNMITLIVFNTTMGIGLLSTFLFTGSQKRVGQVVSGTKEGFLIILGTDISVLIVFFFWLMPIVLGISIFTIYSQQLKPIKNALKVSIIFISLGISYIIANTILGVIAYKLVYHSTATTFLLYIGFIILGIYLASIKNPKTITIYILQSIVTALLITASIITFQQKQVESNTWEKQYSTKMMCDYKPNFKPEEFIELSKQRPMPEFKEEVLLSEECEVLFYGETFYKKNN